MNSFFRSSPDPSRRDGRDESSSVALHEAIMDSVSSARNSLPKEHHTHFDVLRQEIIDFSKAHNIPRESLAKPDALRDAASKLSTKDLEHLATLLERFEYLLKNREPMKEKFSEALEYAEKYYHIKRQYDSQVSLLEQVGILKEGAITGIDGKKYPIPTLEQIAQRIFERRGDLEIKHDQGFTKLLLVPFGMSLDSLCKIFKQSLLKYKESHPDFALRVIEPLWTWEGFQESDIGDSPKLVYEPKSFDGNSHQGRTKIQILEDQEDNQDSFLGWTVHLLQPSNPKDQDSSGFALIPRKGKGITHGEKNLRPDLEAGQSPNEYLSTFQKAQDKPDSPYFQESGMNFEDWIMAFMLHLQETGKPLDNHKNDIESTSYLTGVFSIPYFWVPYACWSRDRHQVSFSGVVARSPFGYLGVRSSVII